MRRVGVIPARWGSSRFPGKPIVAIAGVPLVVRVLRRAAACRDLDEVLVATDDARIAAVVRAAGGRVAMTRADHPSGTDRIAEAVSGMAADVVVNIQGDEPLIDPGTIAVVARGLDAPDGTWGMATAATPLASRDELVSPNVVKVVCDGAGGALYFSRAAIPYARDGVAAFEAAPYARHLGLYAYRREVLERLVREPPADLETIEQLEQLRALALGIRIRVLRVAERGIGVDTPADVAYVEAMLRGEGQA